MIVWLKVLEEWFNFNIFLIYFISSRKIWLCELTLISFFWFSLTSIIGFLMVPVTANSFSSFTKYSLRSLLKMKGLVINKQLYYFKVGFSTHVSFQLLILTTVIIISLFWSFLLAAPILNAVVGFFFFFILILKLDLRNSMFLD